MNSIFIKVFKWLDVLHRVKVIAQRMPLRTAQHAVVVGVMVATAAIIAITDRIPRTRRLIALH